MTRPIVLRSRQDASVNFVDEADGGFFEARYVRRRPEYFIVYVSSHAGCDLGCRMCHLTQTRQRSTTPATLADYLGQANRVFAHYDAECADGVAAASVVHFNFMARGEAFANPTVLSQGAALLGELARPAVDRDLTPVFKLSTILPRTIAGADLAAMFAGGPTPDIYWSVYSTDPVVRRRWLPKAGDVNESAEMLAAWQATTRKIPVLHWAFIEGVNDTPETVDGIVELCDRHGLRVDVNIVRYNPYSPVHGREPAVEVIDALAARLRAGLPGAHVQVVGRVGVDVAASCGMFVTGDGTRTSAS